MQKGEPSSPARALTGVPTHPWLGYAAKGTLVVQRGILSGGKGALGPHSLSSARAIPALM